MRRRRATHTKSVSKSNDGKLPSFDERKSHTSQGNTDSLSQEEPKEPTSRHIIIKMAKFQDKERILKAPREKQEVTYKGARIRVAADFSMETLQVRREWQGIIQVMKTKGLQPRLHYTARLSIKMEGQIRISPDKRSLKEYTSSKPALQEMLKGLL